MAHSCNTIRHRSSQKDGSCNASNILIIFNPVIFAQNPSDFIYQKCYQHYRQTDHRLLSSLQSYSRVTAPLLWARGTCWLSEGSPSGYWGVAPTAQSLEETLRTPTFHVAEWINSDVQSVNIGIYSAWTNASDRRWLYTLVTHRRHGNTPSTGTPLTRDRESSDKHLHIPKHQIK